MFQITAKYLAFLLARSGDRKTGIANFDALQAQGFLCKRRSAQPSLCMGERKERSDIDFSGAGHIARVESFIKFYQGTRCNMADNGDETRSAEGKPRQVNRIITGIPGQTGFLDQFCGRRKVALSVLYGLDGRQIRKAAEGIRCHWDARAARDVIDADRSIRCIRDGSKVAVDALLGGLGVVGRDHEQPVDADLGVRAGEIVGIAGVEGNGQTELVETIAGLVGFAELCADGELTADGSELGEQRSLAFNVHAVRVAVDPTTGTVRILQSIQSADAGFVMNPAQCRGQIEGGVAQGIGSALYEEVMVSPEGKVTTPVFRTYRVPQFADVPETEVYFADTSDDLGPFGAKSMSESPYNPVAPALANAIRRALGTRPYELPMSRDRVWRLAQAQAVAGGAAVVKM